MVFWLNEVRDMNRTKLVVALIVVIGIGAGIWTFGFYPVARINDEIMWYRTYSNRAGALLQFESKSRLAAGAGQLSETEQNTVKKAILENLIAEVIFRQYIDAHTALAGLNETAHAVVQSSLKEANPDVLPRAAKELYGWSVEELTENVLFPQAMQNELRKEIEKDGALFEEFAKTQLQNAQVKLYIVPWKWENGRLAEKFSS